MLGDREEKLAKAREKLDKFRKRKKQQKEFSLDEHLISGASGASLSNSPVISFLSTDEESIISDSSSADHRVSNSISTPTSMMKMVNRSNIRSVKNYEVDSTEAVRSNSLASYFGGPVESSNKSKISAGDAFANAAGTTGIGSQNSFSGDIDLVKASFEENVKSTADVDDVHGTCTLEESQEQEVTSYFTGQQARSSLPENQVNSTQSEQQVNSFLTEKQVTPYLPKRQVNSFQSEQQVNSYLTEQQVTPYLPERQVNSSLLEKQVNSYLPEKQVNSSLIEKQVNSDPSEKLVNSRLPEKQVSSYLPEKQVNSCLLEKQTSSSLPEKQDNSYLPEKPVNSCLPEKQVNSCLPEKQVNSYLPEKQVNSCLPEKQTCSSEQFNSYLLEKKVDNLSLGELKIQDTMGDREDKLAKAREKLEKFRKQKNKPKESSLADNLSGPSPVHNSPSPVNSFLSTEGESIISNSSSADNKSTEVQSSIQKSFSDAVDTTVTTSNGLASYFGGSEEGCNKNIGGDAFVDTGTTGTFDRNSFPEAGRQISNIDNDLIKACLEEKVDSRITADAVPFTSTLSEVQEQQVSSYLAEGQVSSYLAAYSQPDKFVESLGTGDYSALAKGESSAFGKVESSAFREVESSALGEVDLSALTAAASCSTDNCSTTTESLQELSSRISGLLVESSNMGSSGLEGRVRELTSQLELERDGKDKALTMFDEVKVARDKMELRMKQEKIELEARLTSEVGQLKANLAANVSTIELLVAEKSELEKARGKLESDSGKIREERDSLVQSVEGLGAACAELREQVAQDKGLGEELGRIKLQNEGEVLKLREQLTGKEEECKELQAKLAQVTGTSEKATSELKIVKTDLEMCRVHLQQLRAAGAQDTLLRDKEAEVTALTSELQKTRHHLAETVASREQLAGERDQLAEQYRSYSRDLASQAERLSEQLRRYQDENAKMVLRETGLVQHVASLESQMQRFVKGGKNVTEEEICRLKERLVSTETELRLSRDEKDKLQEMFTDRSSQVEETMKRLAISDNKVTELLAKISGLETTCDMLRVTSQSSCSDQAELLAACESDKVAASRAMQQNVELKGRLEELQCKVVSLTNSKAEVADELENSKIRLAGLSRVDAEIEALRGALRERDMMIQNLRNQVKYLESELSQRKSPGGEEEEEDEESSLVQELEGARDMIRWLNSHNSELRSQLEVLNSQTREGSQEIREGSQSRCTSGASTSTSSSLVEEALRAKDDYINFSSSSESTESFVEVENIKNLPNSYADDTDIDDKTEEEIVDKAEETAFLEKNNPVVKNFEVSNLVNSPVDNPEAMRQLEARFISAMEQLAVISSDKEQLEHLVERLQEETETIGDYVIMYQHQRKQQRLRIQEKEDQVTQLANDRAELQTKLSQLQHLVTDLVRDDQVTETTDTAVEEENKEKKILELLTEIGTDSSQMVERCEQFQPWFWENSPSKVLEV